jgi:GT2 family glycosyltransferase
MLDQVDLLADDAAELAPSWVALGEVPDINADYADWLRKQVPSRREMARKKAALVRWCYRPTISLIVPIALSRAALALLVKSLREQVYGFWELCLPSLPRGAAVRGLLTNGLSGKGRIKVLLPTQGDPWTATNEAATGDFVLLLARPGILDPLALYEVVRLLNAAPATDFIYADQDKVKADTGLRWDPFFKPDWSPDLLLSLDYLSDFAVYRRSLVEQVGGIRPAPVGAQAYDLALRVSEQTERIRHIPRVLFSRLARPEAVNGHAAPQRQVDAASRRALREAVRRRNLKAKVEPGTGPSRYRIRYELRERSGVTLVIPSGGKLEFLEPCLDSVLTKSTYPDLRVLVVDNSAGNGVKALCNRLARQHPQLTCRPHRLATFNYSALNNFAVRFVDTPYVMLLNDDITVITPGWIEAMLEHAQRPEVGIVGAKLLYPDDTIQHAGVVMGPHDNTVHAFRYYPAADPGYFGLAQVVRNCSAVTFACALMRKAVYEEVGGLDERNLRLAYNDTDMCLRVRERGYRIIYTPHAVLYHHESVTKQALSEPNEDSYMRRRWADVIRHDPYYSPNLTRTSDDYSLQGTALKATSVSSIGLAPGGSYRARKLAHRFAYEILLASLRKIVRPLLPDDATVLVVSKGDEKILQLGPWRGRHFPQTARGIYAGHHPGDSDEAIEHLEALRKRGADYLLFPATSFWWLAYYASFTEHLDANYCRHWSDETCVLFDMSERRKTRENRR